MEIMGMTACNLHNSEFCARLQFETKKHYSFSGFDQKNMEHIYISPPCVLSE